MRDLQSRFAGPFTFDLAAGECLALIGSSGAGKSVLLRMLADLEPHQGELLLNGAASTAMPAPAWRSQVVYQGAEPAWWEATAEEHFSATQLRDVKDMLGGVGLGVHLLGTPLNRLSTGERQRLALLRSLSIAPQVLLLDEPTAALDPESVGAVERLLRRFLAQGMALVLVTHSHEQAQRLGRRVMRIEHGRFVMS